MQVNIVMMEGNIIEIQNKTFVPIILKRGDVDPTKGGPTWAVESYEIQPGEEFNFKGSSIETIEIIKGGLQ